MKKTIILILVSVLLTVLSVQAQTRIDKIMFNKVIRIGITGTQAPFSLMSKTNNLIGFEVDLGNRLASGLGIEVKYVQLPFAELLPALKDNKIDIIMSGMSMTTKRNLKVAFVGPYLITGKSLLTKSDKYANIKDVSELDMKSTKVGTLRGSTSEQFVKDFIPTANLTLVDHYADAVDLVRGNKIDVMIADYSECLYATLKYSTERLKTLDHTLTNERIGIALPADDPLMINILQNFLGEIKDSGELDALEAKWFQSGSWLTEAK